MGSTRKSTLEAPLSTPRSIPLWPKKNQPGSCAGPDLYFKDSRLGKLECQVFLAMMLFFLCELRGFWRVWGLDSRLKRAVRARRVPLRLYFRMSA
jgi:hypothetical protein